MKKIKLAMVVLKNIFKNNCYTCVKRFYCDENIGMTDKNGKYICLTYKRNIDYKHMAQMITLILLTILIWIGIVNLAR